MSLADVDYDLNEYINEHPTEESWADIGKDVLSGTVGGIAQVLVGQPFDTTKVRLQSAPEGTYNGAIDCVKQLYKSDGAKGFYKGTLTPLIGVGACVSVQFAVNEKMKRFWESRNALIGQKTLGYGQLYLSGAAAGLANSFLASPIEHVRIRLQTSSQFSGPMDCFKQLRGSGSVMRGLLPTMIRESHGMGTFFMLADALTRYDMTRNNIERSQVPAWRTCLYGGLGGVGLWLSVYPVDVVKSRLQTDALSKGKRKYSGMLDCFAKTWKTGGINAFTKGMSTAVVRAAPVNAATFVAFETTRKFLG